MPFYMMKFSKLILSIPWCLGFSYIQQLCLWVVDEIIFGQFVKNNIEKLSQGSVYLGLFLDLWFWSNYNGDGISLIFWCLVIRCLCVVLIFLLWSLFVCLLITHILLI